MKKVMIVLICVITALGINSYQSNKKRKAIEQQKYDFRNEKYQDFYSIQSRKLYKGFDKYQRKVINKMWDWKLRYEDVLRYTQQFDIENPHNIPQGWLDVRRIAPENDKIYRDSNHFTKKTDILTYYQKRLNGEYIIKPCDTREEVPNLICLNINNRGPKYFYLPNTSKKYPFIEQSITFFCDAGSKPVTRRACTLFNYPDKPLNIDIGIEFTDPNNFFYILPYVENLLFNATGEHIWQTSHKQTTQDVSK